MATRTIAEYVDYVEYLDELRKSGRANMFGASVYLNKEFDLPLDEARTILCEWIGMDRSVSCIERGAALAAKCANKDA